jgi:hypothetical protein
MATSDANRELHNMEPIGKAALIASVGGARGHADWTNPDHRLRRLLSEFIGVAGLTFVLSGGAAILVEYGGRALQPWRTSCADRRRRRKPAPRRESRSTGPPSPIAARPNRDKTEASMWD